MVEFCEKLEREGVDLPWMVSGIRADRLTEESVKSMKEAGCLLVNIGVESIDPGVFGNLNKGERIEEILEAIELCKRHGWKQVVI